MMDVYDDLERYWLSQNYDICTVGYDPYNADSFISRYERENGPYGIVKVRQGAQTESVPLGELKILAQARQLYFHQAIMHFTMGNAAVWEDLNGNRKLIKLRNGEKIDNVSALLDAYVAVKANPDQFN